MAALCQTVVIPACVAVWLAAAAFGSAGIENTGAAPIIDRVGPSLAANAAFSDKPQQVVLDDKSRPIAAADADGAAVGSLMARTTATTPVSRDTEPMVTAALTDSAEMLPPETAAAQPSMLSTPGQDDRDAGHGAGSVEVLDECFVVDACIDRYLWALYQRTPKEDSIKEQDRRKVTIKRKGKPVTVTRTFTKLVDEDFAWKDPKAAGKVGMSMMDYVIGGMDRGFKLKLFQALRAAEAAGLSPGITSGFRDDYRQSLASGLKAADNRSYHGGSFRGGYGHGLAADIVSVNGATRAQRWTSTEMLWKWIDAYGKQFGIARPYLDRDPPHVAPVDGQEYADHNPGAKAKQSRMNSKKPNRLTAHADHGTTRHKGTSKSSKVRTT